jgi:hypothetical protein
MDDRVKDDTGLGTQDGTIQVRVKDLSQLFDTLDPFPFPERDLDKEAEEFIVGWARELPHDHPLKIVVHMPAGESQKHNVEEIREALNRFFDYRVGVISRDLNEHFRVGRLSLMIGLAVLVLAFALNQLIARVLIEGPLERFIQESVIIVAWVANWRPIEIFLYSWWPIVRRRNLYRRLAEASVELKPY